MSINWSDSETGQMEAWKNPLIHPEDALQIADGAVAFRDRIIHNLRQQIEELKSDQEK